MNMQGPKAVKEIALRNVQRNPAHRKLLALLIAVMTVAVSVHLSSCAGYSTNAVSSATENASVGTLSDSPSSLSFGSVNVGSGETLSLRVSNTGAATVGISQATISGQAFSVAGGNLPSTIPAGQSATVSIQFAPQSAGAAAGTFTIVSDAANSPLAIALSGTGIQAALSANPLSISFGSILVGSNKSTSVTLTNSGTAPVSVSAASVSGAGFALSGFTTGTLNPGATSSLTVTFAPTTEGSATGTISISSNAPGSPVTIALSGTGLEALASASPTSVAFGSVVVGNSNSSVITLKNTGNATLTFSQVSVSGAGFSFSGLTTSSTIAAGGTLNFNAVYTPTSATSSSGSINLVTNGAPAQITIALTGSGAIATQSLSASPASLSFGNVQVGDNSGLTTIVTNDGDSNAMISGITVTGNGYTASGITSGLILRPNQAATLSVTFAPTTLGSATGSVSIASNASNSPTKISLSGESHQVQLSWIASTSTGVTGYYVYRETASGQYSKLNASSPVSSTQYTDATVQAGMTYSYVVTAVNSSGVEGPYSSSTTVSIP